MTHTPTSTAKTHVCAQPPKLRGSYRIWTRSPGLIRVSAEVARRQRPIRGSGHTSDLPGECVGPLGTPGSPRPMEMRLTHSPVHGFPSRGQVDRSCERHRTPTSHESDPPQLKNALQVRVFSRSLDNIHGPCELQPWLMELVDLCEETRRKR